MGTIVINVEYCKGCELCTTACAFKLIKPGKGFNKSGYYVMEFNYPKGACTGCALCAEMCPDVAIEVWKKGVGRQEKYHRPRFFEDTYPIMRQESVNTWQRSS